MMPRIRPMARGDKPAVKIILQTTPEFKPSEMVVAEEVIDSYLHDPTKSGYHILLAMIDSDVAGYVCYGTIPLTEGTWDIYWLAVAPDRQRRGIASALLTSAEDKIKGARGRMVLIETSSTSAYEKARSFYLHQGYEMISQIPDFYALGDDKLILRKRLI